MATVAFLAKGLNLRGATVAIYDYAEACETELGHRAVVLIDEEAAQDPFALARFQARFALATYRGGDDIDRALEAAGADLVYAMKGDGRDLWTARAAPTVVHQVFPVWPRDLHGAAYAFVSRWLANYSAGPQAAWVPHIVKLPPSDGDLRAELAIPADALVLGALGGADCFDLDFAKTALARALDQRRDLYFVALNVKPFLQHERALFLPGTAEAARKRRFIESCDAMLHARRRGETFGLAVAEFSLCNRPVLAWTGCHERAHLEMLGDAALLYRNGRDLTALLKDLDRAGLKARDWDRYSRDYAPSPVMARFDDVFIRNRRDPAPLRSAFIGPDELSLGGLGRYARRWRRWLRGKRP